MSRIPRILIVLGAIAGICIVAYAMYAIPRWTRTDRERLALAKSVRWQECHLADIRDASPTHYYVDMRLISQKVRDLEYSDPPLDEAGVPIVDYVRVKAGGMTERRGYNPVTIAQYALGRYEDYLHGDEAGLADFMVQAEWLRRALGPDGSLRFDFSVPSRGLTPGWKSAMAQGEAISVFCRAWTETGDKEWLTAADLAFGPLSTDIGSGGVSSLTDDEVWPEEYPAQPPSHVLNGALFAAFGIYDLSRVPATRSDEAGRMLAEFSTTLRAALPAYERDGWVRYQLSGEAYATKTYYGLHIAQLEAMAQITGEDTFHDTARRWSFPLEHPNAWLAKRALVRFGQRIKAHTGL